MPGVAGLSYLFRYDIYTSVFAVYNIPSASDSVNNMAKMCRHILTELFLASDIRKQITWRVPVW